MPENEESIHLRTFGDLLQHGYKLTGHCRRCSVHKAIDLTAVPAERVYVGARFKCRECESQVEITLSPLSTGGGSSSSPALEKWRSRPDRL